MAISQEKLTRWQSIASIAASIAIPMILAVFGYLVQNQIASEGLKKDYVQIAISILKENPSAQEPEMRAWAVKVLDENSPIPFSNKVKTSFEKGFPLVISNLVFPEAPDSCMEPAAKLSFTPLFKAVTKKGYLEIEDPRDFTLKMLKESEKAEINTAKLKCLQEWISAIKKSTDEFNEKQAKASGSTPKSGK